jgi:hypothetical protein
MSLLRSISMEANGRIENGTDWFSQFGIGTGGSTVLGFQVGRVDATSAESGCGLDRVTIHVFVARSVTTNGYLSRGRA